MSSLVRYGDKNVQCVIYGKKKPIHAISLVKTEVETYEVLFFKTKLSDALIQ
jgi:hypothetical protein